MSETALTVGTWLQALFTIFLVSAVFKDNPLYRFTEHTYVGLAGTEWRSRSTTSVRTSRRIYGRRYALLYHHCGSAHLHQVYQVHLVACRYNFPAGYRFRYVLAMDFAVFVDQVRATFLPLWGTGDWWVTVSNWVYVVGTVCALVYFLFTIQKKGVQGKVSMIGRYTMMIAFGSAFGNTVMARVSLFLGRMQFLLGDWLGLIK